MLRKLSTSQSEQTWFETEVIEIYNRRKSTKSQMRNQEDMNENDEERQKQDWCNKLRIGVANVV